MSNRECDGCISPNDVEPFPKASQDVRWQGDERCCVRDLPLRDDCRTGCGIYRAKAHRERDSGGPQESRKSSARPPVSTGRQQDDAPDVVHAYPEGVQAVTGCCGRTPFELNRWSRMTGDPTLVTCTTISRTFVDMEKLRAELLDVFQRHGVAKSTQGWALFDEVLRMFRAVATEAPKTDGQTT